MTSRSAGHGGRSEIIRSPALFLKQLEVSEGERSRGKRLLSGTRLKSLTIPFLYWMLKHTPVPVALFQVRLIIGFFRVWYWWPRNPLRQSCENICTIAAREGHHHQSARVYRQYLDNLLGTAENYFRLYRNGISAVVDQVELSDPDAERMRQLVKQYGGVILAVPHNVGSAFAGLRLNRAFPMLLVAKNSSTIARTRIALNMFERMQVQVLMVRGGNPFELSRALFSVLKSQKVVAATLDNVDGSDAAVSARMFGQDIRFASWAAKLAARRVVPIVPSYFASRGRRVIVTLGQERVPEDVDTAVQYYIDFFESQVLQDPASWAYLGDKRWQRALRAAVAVG